MGNLTFSEKSWEQYVYWLQTDKAMLKKINALIKDIQRNGCAAGKGKPEPLRYRKAWSRRIDQEHRLVYNMDQGQNIIIISCKGHYSD